MAKQIFSTVRTNLVHLLEFVRDDPETLHELYQAFVSQFGDGRFRCVPLPRDGLELFGSLPELLVAALVFLQDREVRIVALESL